MIYYIIKRLLFFIPTMILISIISFFLLQMAPGDPVLTYMELDGEDVVLNIHSPTFKKSYQKYKEELHLDKPSFYFNIKPSNKSHQPYTNHDIRYIKLYNDYADQHIDHRTIIQYIDILQKLEQSIVNSTDHNPEAQEAFHKVVTETDLSELRPNVESIFFTNSINKISQTGISPLVDQMISESKRFILPKFYWNGMDNQYHYWFSSFINGSSIKSYLDGSLVSEKIQKSIKWTLAMVLPALLISFFLSIFLGVYQSKHPHHWGNKWVNAWNYFMYAIPVFWLATILLIIFGQGIYANSGSINTSFHWRQLILPTIVIVLHNMAYISRQMYHSMIKQSKENYIKTAKSKGVTEAQLTWKHQFKNALLPMITMMTAAIPASLSGSVVLETIYNIPGMGRMLYLSILQMDWPVVFSSLLFLSLISLLFLLIGDILYAWINPKIRFGDG